MTRTLSIGVDVGGTNTDAVALDGAGRVIAWTKQPTSDDVTGGIRAAIAALLAEIGDRRSEVSRVMLGTTHATNAIVRTHQTRTPANAAGAMFLKLGTTRTTFAVSTAASPPASLPGPD